MNVEILVSAVEGRLLVNGQDMGEVTGFIPNGEYTITLAGDDVGKTAPTLLSAGQEPDPADVLSASFVPGASVYLTGDRFTGDGVVEKLDGGDVVLRLTESGKRVRVFANEVDRMLSDTGPASTDTTAYISGPDGLTVGQTVYLDGNTFQGLARVETFKDGDAILRMPLDEASGRTNVRIRISGDDYAEQMVFAPVASASDFAVGNPVSLAGRSWNGEGSVVKTTSSTVSIRLNDGGGRRGRGTRLRVDANDLAAGRLTPA